MTEQAQGQNTAENNESNESQERTTNRDFDKANAPEHRLDELNRKRKEAEKRAKDAEARVAQIERAQQEQEENRAQAQGEYQQLAEKRQKKIEQQNARIQELENQIVTDRRYRAWVAGASGAIKPAAIGDAFEMVTEDEWATVNEDDENSIRMLAQNLAERKEYLAAGPIGAGSGGSKKPVYGLGSNNTNTNGVKTGTQGSRPTMHFKKQRPSWK